MIQKLKEEGFLIIRADKKTLARELAHITIDYNNAVYEMAIFDAAAAVEDMLRKWEAE